MFFFTRPCLACQPRLGDTRRQSRVDLAHLPSNGACDLRQLHRAQPLRVAMTADGRTIPARAAALTITVNLVDDSSGRNFGRTELCGRKFGIYIVDAFSLEVLLSLILRVLCGRRNVTMREYMATEIDITTRGQAVRVMNDGELSLLAPPLRYRMHCGALRVVVPTP